MYERYTMKRLLKLIAVNFIIAVMVFGQTSTAPSAGDGSSGNPYQITSLNNLYWLSQNSAQWNKYFILMNDVDASATFSWSGGFTPIGNGSTAFTGIFHGNGYCISNLYINRPAADFVGLFGNVNYPSTIDYLTVTNSHITGNRGVGGMIGLCSGGMVNYCNAIGVTVMGNNQCIGGLIGWLDCSTLVGTATGCSATGTVTTATADVGGLVGWLNGYVYDSYARVSVTAQNGSHGCGGVVGFIIGGTVVRCYAAGSLNSPYGGLGGIVGGNQGGSAITNCFWNNSLYTGSSNSYGTGVSTAAMQVQSTYTGAGWSFPGTWAFIDDLYPEVLASLAPRGGGTSGNPYSIKSLGNLLWLSVHSETWGNTFVQTTDIDAASTVRWNSGSGFSPIGNNTVRFTGTYNGNFHTIKNLSINRPSSDNIGLFGLILGGSVQNLGLTNETVRGGSFVGGIAGMLMYGATHASIISCYSTGNVAGNYYVGGLLGWNAYGPILTAYLNYCYSTADVTGVNDVGGLVGYNESTVSKCYATGNVAGSLRVGGLIGVNEYSISECYAGGNVAGNTFVGGLIGTNPTSSVSVYECYSSGSVSGTDAVGALLGWNSGMILHAYWNSDANPLGVACGHDVGTSGFVYGITTMAMKYQSSTTALPTEHFGVIDGWSYPALKGLRNNAPFAFSDNLITNRTLSISTSILANDYDYETAQSKLVYKIQNCAGLYGSISGNTYTFNSEAANSSMETIVYRVGELLTSGDTLWGNRATANIILNVSLPVELAGFTASAKQNSVELKWNTATEINNYGFDVERKAVSSWPLANSQQLKANSWSTIGFVEGNGTTNAPKEYSFTERNISAGKYSYRLKQLDRDGKFSYSQEVEAEITAAPAVFALEQNYPNPFNPATTITYQLPVNSHVTLKLYDAVGREAMTLVNEMNAAGRYAIPFDASHLASGVYFYRMTAGSFTGAKKLLLLK